MQNNQSTYEYVESLQLEYIVYELRSKIYSREKDVKFCKRVMESKKSKIDEITRKKNIPTIFTSAQEKVRLYDIIVRPNQYPGFDQISYTSQEQQTEFKEKDFYAYYDNSAEFRIQVDLEGFKSGKLIRVHKNRQTAIIQLKGESKTAIVSINHVIRIL